jgi:hypothetical protein
MVPETPPPGGRRCGQDGDGISPGNGNGKKR